MTCDKNTTAVNNFPAATVSVAMCNFFGYVMVKQLSSYIVYYSIYSIVIYNYKSSLKLILMVLFCAGDSISCKEV